MKIKLLSMLRVCFVPLLAAADPSPATLTVIFDNGEVRVLNGVKPEVYRLERYDAAEADSIDQVVIDPDARLVYVRPVTRFRERRMDVYRFGDRKRLMALPGVSDVVIPQGGKADVVLAFRFQPAHAKDLREADLLFEDFIKLSDRTDDIILQTRRRNVPNVIIMAKNYNNTEYIGDLPFWARRGCYSDRFHGFLDSSRGVIDMLTFDRSVSIESKIDGLSDVYNHLRILACNDDDDMLIESEAGIDGDMVFVDSAKKRVHRFKGGVYPAECFAVWNRSAMGCLVLNTKAKDIEYYEHSWRSDLVPMLRYHLGDVPELAGPLPGAEALVVVGRDTKADCVYFTELHFGRLDIKWNGPDLFELCLTGKPAIREVELGTVGRGQKVVGVYVQ